MTKSPMTSDAKKALLIITLVIGAFVVVPLIFVLIAFLFNFSKLKAFGIGIVIGILNSIAIYVTQVHKLESSK